MKFLPSLDAKVRTKAPMPTRLPPDNGSVRRTIPLQQYQMNTPYVPPSVGSDVNRFVRDTYERVTWVFKAVHAVAHNAARLKMTCRTEDAIDGPEQDHYLLPLLNWRASPWTNEQAYAFRYRVSAQLELSTRGVFIETPRARNGEVLGLHLLPPGAVTVIPSATKFVGGYLLQIGAEKYPLAPENVLWIKAPHPLDPYRSMTPYEAAGMAIDTDWLGHLYNANFMRNDGRGAGLIAAKGGIDENDADELNAYFLGGPEQAGRWRVIEADGLDFVDFATNPRDAQYVEMRNLSKEEIYEAAGVPETVAGNASGRTWDNASVEYEVFWNEKMLGHLECINGGYDILDGQPDTFIVPDLSRVPALQRMENERRAEMRDEVAAGLRTIDSYMAETGQEPFDVPQTQVPLVSMGVGPLFTTGRAPAPPAPTPPTDETQPPPTSNGSGTPGETVPATV